MIVESNVEIAKDIFEMVLIGEQVKTMKKAGQFLHLKMKDTSLILRRPISIASIDETSCSIIYRVVGSGTKDMSVYQKGETLDVLGPLGNGFNLDFIETGQHALVVGGGIGVAPLYELGKRLKDKGAIVTFVLGFASKEEIYYEERFRELGAVIVTTDNGTRGIKGHVGKGVECIDFTPDAVFACGPIALNMFVQTQFADIEHVYLSLEERMACGVGACYGCETKRKDKRVCADGPVFHRSEVDL